MNSEMDMNRIIEEGLQSFTLDILPKGKTVIGNYHEILSEDSDDEFGGKTRMQAVRYAEKLKEKQRKDLESHGLLKIINEINDKVANAKKKKSKEEEEDVDFDNVYCDFEKLRLKEDFRNKIEDEVVESAMKKSVMVPGLEKKESLPVQKSIRQAAKERKQKREASKGKGWFDMPAAEMTEEVKNDLEILKMRSVLDPKQFYKKNDMEGKHRFFQVGTVVESSADFYSSRIPRRQRKRTMVEELLADAEFQQYNKRRYTEIVEERRKTSFKAHRHAARLKRKAKGKGGKGKK